MSREGLLKIEKEYLERLWIRRAREFLRAMPATLELVAYNGSVSICKAGSLRAFLDSGITSIAYAITCNCDTTPCNNPLF